LVTHHGIESRGHDFKGAVSEIAEVVTDWLRSAVQPVSQP
jgi:hypothetical protein